jgi:hypothetical protein
LKKQLRICGMALALSVAPTVSFASDKYIELQEQGFKTGPLSRNQAGTNGWIVKKGSEAYFCRADVGIVSNGKDFKAGRPKPSQVGRCSKINPKST